MKIQRKPDFKPMWGSTFSFDTMYSKGPSCSKLTTSLVNVSLKFQTLISQIRQYFLMKKCEKLKLLSFLQQKISVYLVIKW